jgi:hypothetical protein
MSESITPQPHDPHHGVTEHAHGHDGHAHGPGSPFSEEEERILRKSDVQAGMYIVCLIGGIFSIGVILYTIVALSVWL